MSHAIHGLDATLRLSTPATAAVHRHRPTPRGIISREGASTASNEAGDLCRLAAESTRRIQNRVRKLVEVAKEHSMPPRNPLPYVLGYAVSGALVAGVVYYNRAALIPRLRSVASWLREVCTDFSQVHVVEPVKNIYTELVYRYVLHCEHTCVLVC